MAKKKIYVDMDGVLADFDRHYENMFGVKPASLKDDPEKFWSHINKTPSFYREIPVMSSAVDLMKECFKITPHVTVLSSPSRDKEECIKQKRAWLNDHIAKHFGSFQFGAVFEKDKHIYACPNSILIDDQEKKIKPWVEAGGIGILHSSFNKTKLELILS